MKNSKRDIIIGVIGSIIGAVVIKCADIILDMAPTAGHSIAATITNIVYSTAAIQQDSFMLTIFLLAFLGFVAGNATPSIGSGISLMWKSLRVEKVVKKFQNIEEFEKYLSKNAPENKTVEKKSTLKENIRDAKKVGVAAIFLAILILCLYLFATVFVLRPVTIREEFNRDIIMIYPYTDESTIYKLKSDWVCMRSKEDYNQIYDCINQIKSTYSLPN